MYLDPGFGGMMVQVIILIVAVGGGVLFSLRKKIKRLFSKDKGNTISSNTSTFHDVPDDVVDVLGDTFDVSDNKKD